jgi:hypothetical protein
LHRFVSGRWARLTEIGHLTAGERVDNGNFREHGIAYFDLLDEVVTHVQNIHLSQFSDCFVVPDRRFGW